MRKKKRLKPTIDKQENVANYIKELCSNLDSILCRYIDCAKLCKQIKNPKDISQDTSNGVLRENP